MIVSVPEYGFSVNVSQIASIRAYRSDFYTQKPWVIEVCYIGDPSKSVLLCQFNNESDMTKAHKLLLERLAGDSLQKT